jgi:hypothetical protein
MLVYLSLILLVRIEAHLVFISIWLRVCGTWLRVCICEEVDVLRVLISERV